MYTCELGPAVYREQNYVKYGMKSVKLVESKKNPVS